MMMIKTLQWTPGVKRLSKSEYTYTGLPIRLYRFHQNSTNAVISGGVCSLLVPHETLMLKVQSCKLKRH